VADTIALTEKLTRPKGQTTFCFTRWDGTPVKAAKHRTDHGDGRGKEVTWRPALAKEDLTQADLAPWNWHDAIAAHQQNNRPIVVVKGELKASWLKALEIPAVSINGWNHTTAEHLLALGDAIVLAPDCDLADLQGWYAKAKAALPQARHLLTPGANWLDPPGKNGVGVDDWIQQSAGSITPDAVLQAIARHAWQPQGDGGAQAAPGQLRIKGKVELQQFLRDTYLLEFNELTRVCEINGNPLEDHHLADSFLAQQHGIEVSKQMAADSFEFIAKSNPYNPVHRYLEGLRERSDLRLISMQELAAAFAIESQDQVSQHLLASHLAGAALRGLTPGHKHDQILILRGEQGTFKSSAIEALAGPWYDSATRVEELESKDFLARINGAWLFEIDECEHTLLKRTASEFKGFISRRNDRYAEKYEKTAKTHWRRSALFGTTNQAEFLNDSTGNRRAWVIDTGNRELSPQWISANRDSIWATVLTWIDWGLSSYAGRNLELAAAAAERAQEANLSDPWEPLLAKVLDAISVDAVAGIALDDLIEKALNISARDCKRDDQMRVTRVVTGAGFRTHEGTVAWQSKKRRYGGGRARAGYEPMPLRGEPSTAENSSAVPTVPTRTDQNEGVGTEVGTGHSPWQRRDLTTLFQPVPTFSLRRDRDKEGSPQDVTQGAQRVAPPLPPEVGTGWNTPENHFAGGDLPVPSVLAQEGGWNGTPLPANGTTVPSPSVRTELPLSLVEPPAVTSPAHLAANAARSNLTTFQPGDRVYIAHQRLPPGRLHLAVVNRVINAHVHFEPPFEGLLNDPEAPDAGAWLPPHPISSMSTANCFHELGATAGVRIESVECDGETWSRLIWQHPDGSTTTREIPPARSRFQPLDGDELDAFLAEAVA
jgi:hypothetical protein